MLRICLSFASAAATAVSMLATALPAQARKPSTAPLVFARESEERWLYARQRAAFTPVTSSSGWVKIVGTERDTARKTRTLALMFSDRPEAGTARLTTDDRGRVVRIAASFAPPRKDFPIAFRVDSAEQLRWAIFDGPAQQFASLPETRVWDLVPVRGAAPLAIGARWTDTLDLHASLDRYRQALRGVRVSTVVGDTIVAGVRLWIVRDSAAVRFDEHLLIEERTLDSLAVVDRSTAGTIVGRHLLDSAIGLDRARDDTTVLAGTAVLRYADGRSFPTAARYERTQHIELTDTTAYNARRRARDTERGEFSIVMRPEGDAERIASGDTNFVAALLDTVALSHDPAARGRAVGLLRYARRPATLARLRAALLRAGDTATVIKGLETRWVDRQQPIDEADFALLLPVMADPGAAFALGIERDPHYEDARQGLLAHPPAVTADPTDWPCTPVVCRSLAAQWNTATEPRLRSLALIAHLTLEPTRWADTVLARFRAGDSFLEPAVALIRGVAASWPAGSHAPLPPPGASWRSWSNWMNGRSPDFPNISPVLARFDDVHAQTIAFARAFTGRDLAAEWRAGMRTATSDSARFVYGSMLLGIGALHDDAVAVAERLQSKSALMRTLAGHEVKALFAASTSRADSATTAELQDRVLAVAIDGEPGWPLLDSAEFSPRREPPMPRNIAGAADHAYERPAATPGPVVLRGEQLDPAVSAKWRGRGVSVVDSQWDLKSSESAVIVTVSDVRLAGSFARVSIDHSHLTARVDGRGQSWASGTTLYLMRRGRGWVIVSADAWIT